MNDDATGDRPTRGEPLTDARAEQVEQLLADVHLAAPSSALDDRVLDALDTNPRRLRLVRRAVAVAMAAAVLIAAAVIASNYRPPAPAAPGGPSGDELAVDADPTTLEATLATTELVDDGMVRVSDAGQPVHQVRRVTTRQFLYYNADTNETLEITVPQEDVIYMVNEPF